MKDLLVESDFGVKEEKKDVSKTLITSVDENGSAAGEAGEAPTASARVRNPFLK